jgi:hypothetical protein
MEEMGFVAVEENGIILRSGELHMQTAVGLPNSSHLLTTDGVLFANRLTTAEQYFSVKAGDPMLIFQRGVKFNWQDPETKAFFNHVNPGGLVFVFNDQGERVAKTAGEKVSLEKKPVTDFEWLRELVRKEKHGVSSESK